VHRDDPEAARLRAEYEQQAAAARKAPSR
jgi:hypothetical protein